MWREAFANSGLPLLGKEPLKLAMDRLSRRRLHRVPWEQRGQLVGAELEKAVNEVVAKLQNERNAEVVGSLLAIQEKKARERNLLSLWISVSSLVAGVGFEPTTFGL
jgi:hypothetical protein